MESIRDIALRRLKAHQLGSVSQASLVLFSAQQFFHHHFTEEPNVVKPLKLQNAVLWVGVQNASVAQEVRGISQKLVRELQSRYGEKTVQRLQTKDLTVS